MPLFCDLSVFSSCLPSGGQRNFSVPSTSIACHFRDRFVSCSLLPSSGQRAFVDVSTSIVCNFRNLFFVQILLPSSSGPCTRRCIDVDRVPLCSVTFRCSASTPLGWTVHHVVVLTSIVCHFGEYIFLCLLKWAARSRRCTWVCHV